MMCISDLSFCQNLNFFHFWHKNRISFVKLAETSLIISAIPFLLSASSRICIHGIPLTGFHRCCTLTTVRAPHPFLWAVAHPSGASISSPGVCLSVRVTIFLSGHRKKSDLGPESRNCVPDRGFGCLAGLPAVSGAKKSRKKSCEKIWRERKK